MSGVSRDAPLGVQFLQKIVGKCCPRLQINRLRWDDILRYILLSVRARAHLQHTPYLAGAGIAQTSGWPGTVATVGKWFGSTKKGLIFGIWNSHTSLGNILAKFVDSDWSLSFVYPALVMGVAGGVVWLFLVPDPSARDVEATEHTSLLPRRNTQTSAISLSRALQIPGVVQFSLSLFFAKLLLAYQRWGASSYLLNCGLLVITGVLVNGPYALITTAVSAELGAAIGPMLAGVVSSAGSWSYVFYMLILCNFCALFLLLRRDWIRAQFPREKLPVFKINNINDENIDYIKKIFI
ncbi:Sugar phosphate exchanger 2, partial [Operophtera brumata]